MTRTETLSPQRRKERKEIKKGTEQNQVGDKKKNCAKVSVEFFLS
jgi:hypothetical protein